MGTLLFTCHIEEMWPLSETVATSSASAKTQLLLGVRQENRWEWGRGQRSIITFVTWAMEISSISEVGQCSRDK